MLWAPGHVNRYLRYTYTNSVSNPFVYHTYANARDRYGFGFAIRLFPVLYGGPEARGRRIPQSHWCPFGDYPLRRDVMVGSDPLLT